MSENKSNLENRGSAAAPNHDDEPVSNKSVVMKGIITTLGLLGGLAVVGYLLYLILN
ncbi:MAG: hypothetical protein WBP29_10045 [Candidatus Zixiibacteriota bacterium]